MRLGSQPPYRLRVDEFRVFYDVEQEEQKVIIYGVAYKEHALDWLADFAQKRGNL
ncbi:MAG: hypothetical protein Fur0044_20350 [Anaerolineae bacterium]